MHSLYHTFVSEHLPVLYTTCYIRPEKLRLCATLFLSCPLHYMFWFTQVPNLVAGRNLARKASSNFQLNPISPHLPKRRLLVLWIFNVPRASFTALLVPVFPKNLPPQQLKRRWIASPASLYYTSQSAIAKFQHVGQDYSIAESPYPVFVTSFGNKSFR